jgi:hypothetical protein
VARGDETVSWLIYFTAVTLTLLAVAGTLAVLTDAYSKALDAYRLAKLTLDQWSSLSSQLNHTVCTAAEEMAKEAVKTLDVERYRELGPAFASALMNSLAVEPEPRPTTMLLFTNFTASLARATFDMEVGEKEC